MRGTDRDDAIVIGAAPGLEVHVLRTGAAVQRIVATCGDGVRRDVALGLRDGEAVRTSGHYVGAVVGRYANRIADGHLEIDGRVHALPVNDRGHHLHGGPGGFHAQEWTLVDHTGHAARLRLVSPDGDQGYPGELTVEATYTVEGATLRLELTARTTEPTVVNLTSHVYLNLHGEGSVDDHLLQVPAGRYLPVDGTGIPVGGLQPLTGTPFDFRQATPIGDALRADHPQLRAADGLDHDVVPDGAGLRRVASLIGPRTRTRADVWSDQPGLQIYTATGFDGSIADWRDRPLHRGAGIALEPQRHPDTPHHEGTDGWPSAVLRPGERYVSRITWTVVPAP